MIINKLSAEHYIWGEGCDSWVLADLAGLSVKQERMPPGTREKLHFHELARQFFYILKGTASFKVGNQTQTVNEQTGILIEPGTSHLISNDTNDLLEFLVISQPNTRNDRTPLEP